MKKVTTWFLNITVFLVFAGMIGHGVLPHHHHQVETEHSCCSDDSDNSRKEPACSIFDYFPLDNVKFNNFSIYKSTLSFVLLFDTTPLGIDYQAPNKSIAFIASITLKKAPLFLKAFSHRGPPVL